MIRTTNQIVYTHCLECNTRLHLPEEWSQGLCVRHADPDTALPPLPEIDWDERLRLIDEYLDMPATGAVKYPNRNA